MTPSPTNGDLSTPVPVRQTCKTCGKPFDTYGTNITGRTVCFITVCDVCTAIEANKRLQHDRELRDAARLARFEKLCDPYYRSAAIRAAMPLEKAQEIRDHVAAGRGVLAYGETGHFKTTCILNGAVRFLVMRGQLVEIVTAAQFRQRTSRASKETDLERYISKLADVPWLFLDDLGNASVGDTGTEAMLSLLEQRIARGMRPLLVSTQYPPKALATRFQREESGKAIVRRLQLLTNNVSFQ